MTKSKGKQSTSGKPLTFSKFKKSKFGKLSLAMGSPSMKRSYKTYKGLFKKKSKPKSPSRKAVRKLISLGM